MYKRRVKQFISLLLSVVLITATLPGDWMAGGPTTAQAAAVETSKIDKEKVVTEEEIPNENLRNYLKELISPDNDLTLGDMLEFTGEINLNLCNESYPISQIDGIGYARSASKIIFDKLTEITEIKEDEFYKCQAEEIKIPDSVTIIGKEAFNKCSNITDINIQNVLTIGESAFSGCSKLVVNSFNNNIISIGNNAFSDCDAIQTITIENGNVELGAGVFQGCKGLTSISLPEGITSIPANFLKGTDKLESIVIPTTILLVDKNAFEHSGIKSLDFTMCENLQKVESYAFAGVQCLSILLPDTVRHIGENAFNASLIVTMTLPRSLTYLGSGAFWDCPILMSVDIPRGVTAINDRTFKECEALEEVTVEDKSAISIIGTEAFYQCKALKDFSFASGLDNLTDIGDNAFQECAELVITDGKFPSKLKSIGNYAFYKCYKLGTIVFPSDLVTIGNYAFYQCGVVIKPYSNKLGWTLESDSGLNEINFEVASSLESIGNYAFAESSLNGTVKLPAISTLGMGAFDKCMLLKSIAFSETLNYIGQYALRDCLSLRSIDIYPNTTIHKDALIDNLPSSITLNVIAQSKTITVTKGSSVDIPVKIGNVENLNDDGIVLKDEFGNEISTIDEAKETDKFCYDLENVKEGQVTYKKIVLYGLNNVENSPVRVSCGLKYPIKPEGYLIFSIDLKYAISVVEKRCESVELAQQDYYVSIDNIQQKIIDAIVNPVDFSDKVNWSVVNNEVIDIEPETEETPVGVIQKERAKIIAKKPGTSEVRIQVGEQQASTNVHVGIPASSISLNKSQLNLYKGYINSEQLIATPAYNSTYNEYIQQGFGDTIQWTSSNPEVAKVDENGKVIAVGSGETTITAKAMVASNVSRTCKVTVEGGVTPPATDLTLSGTPVINVGSTMQITSTLTPSSAANKVEYSVDTRYASIVSVDSNTGVVTGLSNGTAQVRAKTDNNILKIYTVTVVNPIIGFHVTTNTINLLAGKTYTLSNNDYTKELASNSVNTTDTLMWSSTDEKIARVTNTGRITAIGGGSADIVGTASSGATMRITVKVSNVATSVSIPTSETLIKGQSVQLTANIVPADACSVATWSSSNNAVATVNSSGLVMAVGVGSCTITVRMDSGVSARCAVTVTNPATSVSIPTSAALIKGKTVKLTASINPTGTSSVATWTSSNSAVATVSNTGLVTAVDVGTCIITVMMNSGVSATCTITVTSIATAVSIPASAALTSGKSVQLTANITPANASSVATWTSSNSKVATVSSTGLVTAVGTGTSIITVRMDSGVSARCTITVTIPSTSVKIKVTSASSKKLYLVKGRSYVLTKVMSPSNTTDQVKWTTSNKRVVSVNATTGAIKGLKTGKATITAKTTSGKKATIMIYVVKKALSAKKISLPSKKTVKKGKTIQLTAKITSSKSTDTISWSSKNNKIATVDAYGKVTAKKKKGTTYIYATTTSGKKAKCRITVK